MKQRRLLLPRSPLLQAGGMVGLTLLALALRTLWLVWQPLWWDEGYSIYFASEPVQRMLQLTADDIHPPLYYYLLHTWLTAGVNPLNARLFSVVVGALTLPLFVWLANELYPQRRRFLLMATLLLLLNPLHLYYSQEVRMYGLALLLSVASSLFLVRLIKRLMNQQSARLEWIVYAILATLALYTLYYLAFLLLAHAVWSLWQVRRQRIDLLKLSAMWLAIGLAYLPWLLYAGMRLTSYVQHKLASDKDQPLALSEFSFRHLSTFVTGHLETTQLSARLESWLALAAILLVILLALGMQRKGNQHSFTPSTTFLWLALLLPATCAFLVNQRSPFFPANGERLLLFVLPYFLLLLALGIDQSYNYLLGKAAFATLLTLALLGVVYFYTVPRYSEDDYRPLIRQIVQQSSGNDTYLATYPWQIGFWRVYAEGNATENAQPLLLSDGSVAWGDAVKSTIDRALVRGVVWFPSLLSIGSTLPAQVNRYFEEQASTNIADRWFSTTTRLDGWRSTDYPPLTDTEIDFGEITINGFAVDATQVRAVNQSLDVAVRWTVTNPNRLFNLTLRLQDSEGRSWVQRDQALGAHWRFEPKGFAERIGMIVPPGIPPGEYQLAIGVDDRQAENALMFRNNDNQPQRFAQLTAVIVEPLQSPASPTKLPTQGELSPAPIINGVAILGYRGLPTQRLAGEPISLSLFYQKQQSSLQNLNLFVSLLDQSGAGVAGWEGWPLPTYTPTAWPDHALVQVPVTFDIPATVASGNYRLVTGLVDVEQHTKSRWIELGSVVVQQRLAHFDPIQPAHRLPAPALLGTHASLIGYDLARAEDGTTLLLYWQVQQPILPAHDIFVHFDDAQGTTVAQIDGAPRTAEGSAPTGSWQAGEMLITVHHYAGKVPDYDHIQVGLYNPANNQRLPVSVDGAVTGDAVVLR